MTDDHPGLVAEVFTEPTGNTVALAGDLDLATVDVLIGRAGSALEQGKPGTLTLDFAGVRFCDSVGIGALVQLRQRCDHAGWQLRVVNMQPSVRRTLVDLCGLGSYLNVVETPTMG